MTSKFININIILLVILMFCSQYKPINTFITNNILLRGIYFYKYNISDKLNFIKCRHEVSCSQYAIDCICNNGAMKGIYMSIKRMNNCI
jgi:putative component of membrane protein insertase Oxa1/YidC/SpoIIIJ protein YidD